MTRPRSRLALAATGPAVAMALAGCSATAASPSIAAEPPPTSRLTPTGDAARTATGAAAPRGTTVALPSGGTCPVTPAITAPEPTPASGNAAIGMHRDPLGNGPWYRSPDGRIWATASGFVRRPGGNKVVWIKPLGAQLQVSGRRLDGAAPPLGVSLPCCYPGDYQASGVDFPTSGCWEIEAQADSTIFRFVVAVQ